MGVDGRPEEGLCTFRSASQLLTAEFKCMNSKFFVPISHLYPKKGNTMKLFINNTISWRKGSIFFMTDSLKWDSQLQQRWYESRNTDDVMLHPVDWVWGWCWSWVILIQSGTVTDGGQTDPSAFTSSVWHSWQQRVAVKQWCGCWGSHIYPPHSVLQQLHRHKERHHYSQPSAVNRPATWGACRLCTGHGGGGRQREHGEVRGWGRRTRCRRSVWDGRSRGENECVYSEVCIFIPPQWKRMNGSGICQFQQR